MLKKLLASVALAALALAPATAQVSLNLNQLQPTTDSQGNLIDPATKQGQGLPTDAPCTTYDTTACGQISIQKQVSRSAATVAATVAPAGSPASTAQTVQAAALPLPAGAATAAGQATNTAAITNGQAAPGSASIVAGGVQGVPGVPGVPGGLPLSVRTQLAGTATNRSAVIGFTSTASAATSASTAATLVVTSNFVNQAGARSGIPMVGQVVTGSGVPAGTTLVAPITETGTANTFNVTFSQVVTLGSGAAVTSGGPQLVMAANTARVSFKQNNQSSGACYYNPVVGTLDANSQQLAAAATIETPDSFATTTTIYDMCVVAAAPVHIIERTYP